MTIAALARGPAVALPDVGDLEPLPVEFVLLRPGTNPNVNYGTAIWDAASAQRVMASAAARGGVDYQIDLAHRSLDEMAVALAPDATDAMGWFNLEVRDGALWAVNVRWTPEGEARLRTKKQRYISPAFTWLADVGGPVGEFVNCALVSNPAINDMPALVAASRALPSVQDRAAAYLAKVRRQAQTPKRHH